MGSYIQSANNSNNGSATSIVTAFGSNIGGAGRKIILEIGFNDSANPGANLVASITDTLGTTYTLARLQSALNVSGAIYHGTTTSGGANTVTVNFENPSSPGTPLSVSNRRLAVHEYDGWDALDQVNSASHDATPPANAPDSGNVTTGFAGELIFGAYFMDSGGDTVVTAGSGFTKREDYQHANGPATTEDKVQTTAGVTKADFALSTDARWVCIVATFKSAVVTSPILQDLAHRPGQQVFMAT